MSVKSIPTTRVIIPPHLRWVGLHLLPGALTLATLLLVAPLAEHIGFPPLLFGFGVGGLLVTTGSQLGYLLYQGWRRNCRLSLEGIVLYRERMPVWQYLVLTGLILAWLAFIWFILRPPVNRFFMDTLFSWMPGFFFENDLMVHLQQYSRPSLIIAATLFTLAISLGGAVEELYFRGYLLPRGAFLGKWAPAVNMLLFSLYHFWSPWENVARILALTPFVYIVWWKRNVYLAVLVHFIINLFSGVSLMALILGASRPVTI
jgi:membrane protease YdiL (CAAX protease family)